MIYQIQSESNLPWERSGSEGIRSYEPCFLASKKNDKKAGTVMT